MQGRGSSSSELQMVPWLSLRGGRGPRDPGLAGGGCSAPGWCRRVRAEEGVRVFRAFGVAMCACPGCYKHEVESPLSAFPFAFAAEQLFPAKTRLTEVAELSLGSWCGIAGVCHPLASPR